MGAHILELCRKSDKFSKIYCLVRGADAHAARERVSKSLEKRGLQDLSPERCFNQKVFVLQSELGAPQLGLSKALYEGLAREVTTIIHVAWTVNFRMRLRSFAKDNIGGVRNLFDLALKVPRTVPPRFAFCSSTASVANYHLQEVPERILDETSSASPLGYSRSKWVAEQICLRAHESTRLHSRIAIFRVGQLSGDTKRGIWNAKEAWPMMLSSAHLIGCLPALQDEPLSWLPIDIAAEAFMQAIAAMDQGGDEIKVYHILNPYQRPEWVEMLEWLKKTVRFDTVSPQEWIKRLENYKGIDEHPVLKLLGHWKQAYCGATETANKAYPLFCLEKTYRAAPVLRAVRPVDEEYFRKIWFWLKSHVPTS